MKALHLCIQSVLSIGMQSDEVQNKGNCIDKQNMYRLKIKLLAFLVTSEKLTATQICHNLNVCLMFIRVGWK